jgi:hypothetical protein
MKAFKLFFLFGFIGLLIIFMELGWLAREPINLLAQTLTASSTLTAALTVTTEISLSAPASFSLLPVITLTNSSSSATGTWNVKTNSPAGYILTLQTNVINALQGNNTAAFTDCPTTTPSLWSAVCASSSNYIFGFSVYGTDVSTATWGVGSDCGSGGNPSSALRYRGFTGTTSIQVASRSQETIASGIDTKMCLAAAQGVDKLAPDGTYQAVIVGTATAQ